MSGTCSLVINISLLLGILHVMDFFLGVIGTTFKGACLFAHTARDLIDAQTLSQARLIGGNTRNPVHNDCLSSICHATPDCLVILYEEGHALANY